MDQPRDIIERHYAASAAANVDGMIADFAPDISWTEMEGFPYVGTYHGPQAVVENVFARLGAEWDDYQAVPQELVVAGDDVVAFGLYTGTYLATGKPVRARFVHHWTVRDGQVLRFEQFTDTALFVIAMTR